MRILILRDDRPGHYLQSDVLAAALARRQPVEVERLRLTTRPLLKGRTLRRLAAAGLPPALIVRLAHGLRLDRIDRPDLVVSAGSETLVANLAMARAWGCANVFIGSLRGVPPTRFSAVMTIYPHLADGDRVVLAAKPTTVDPDRLPAPRPIAGAADLAGARVAVMAGGPTPTHLWQAADWRALADLVAGLAGLGARLSVTTSPRTPAAAVAALAGLAATPGIEVSVYGRPDALPRDHFFAADAIIVSGDSATMAFEAVAARRPVVALDPPQRRPARDDAAFAWLAEEGGLVRLALPASAAEIAAGLAAAKPAKSHPMDAVLAPLAPPLGRVGINVTVGEL